jgi:hypothetical protein
MATRVCSTGSGYPQTPPTAATYTDDQTNLLTADADMVIPHNPITKIQYNGGMNCNFNYSPLVYPFGKPGQASTPYYNVVTGKNDLAMVVTASSTHTTPNHEAWRVMNCDSKDQWWSMPGLYDAAGLYVGTQPEGGEWIHIKFPYPVSIYRYVLILGEWTLAAVDCQPKRWKLIGTTDGTTWENIRDRTAVDFNWVDQWDGQDFITATIKAKMFKEIKIVFTKLAPNQSYMVLAAHSLTGCQHTGTH